MDGDRTPRTPQGLHRDGRRGRQDLPDAAGRPRRAGRGPRRRDRATWSPTAGPRPRRSPRAWRRCRGGQVTYRGAELEEMDLPALLRRAPELALIDQLAPAPMPLAAPSTASGTRTSAAVLADGIDVFSTVNVQHLEKPSTTTSSELTGTRVREVAARRGARQGQRPGAHRPDRRGSARAAARREGLSA